MEYRDWMTDEMRQKIIAIANYIPESILNPLFDLMEDAHQFWSSVYSTVTELIYTAVVTNPHSFSFSCNNNSKKYDDVQEICYYLDGWVWQIKDIAQVTEDKSFSLGPLQP